MCQIKGTSSSEIGCHMFPFPVSAQKEHTDALLTRPPRQFPQKPNAKPIAFANSSVALLD